jgi:hypothetical protein
VVQAVNPLERRVDVRGKPGRISASALFAICGALVLVPTAAGEGVCSEQTPQYCPAPHVKTTKAVEITEHTAVLTGEVNPNGLPTSCYFQWGLTRSYGNVTPTRRVGHGTSLIHVRARITGLKANTVYHYQLVCTNKLGTFFGGNRDFKTLAHGKHKHHAKHHAHRR